MSETIAGAARRMLQLAVRGHRPDEAELERFPAEIVDAVRAAAARIVGLFDDGDVFGADRERRASADELFAVMDAARWSPNTPLRPHSAEAEAAIAANVATVLGQSRAEDDPILLARQIRS